MAVYQNNAAWPSPISIPDLTNWQSIFGIDIAGLCSNKNNGAYSCQLTTYRSGLYSLSVKVNGLNVLNSPWSPVNVAPTELYAPSCVPKGIPLTMVAGTQYTFQIQSRDFFSNNMNQALSQAIGTNYLVSYSGP
jgi:hypothetical protein